MSGSSQEGDSRAAAMGTLRTHGDGGHESQDVRVPGRGLTKWIETSIYTGESRLGQAPPLWETQFSCITRGLTHPEPGQTSLINHSTSSTVLGDSKSCFLPSGLDEL